MVISRNSAREKSTPVCLWHYKARWAQASARHQQKAPPCAFSGRVPCGRDHRGCVPCGRDHRGHGHGPLPFYHAHHVRDHGHGPLFPPCEHEHAHRLCGRGHHRERGHHNNRHLGHEPHVHARSLLSSLRARGLHHRHDHHAHDHAPHDHDRRRVRGRPRWQRRRGCRSHVRRGHVHV